jgi:hypothetical protein
LRKGKHILVKNDITRDIHAVCGDMKTLVTLVERAIAEEDTFFRSKFEFVFVVRTEVRPTCTAEHLEKGIIRYFT